MWDDGQRERLASVEGVVDPYIPFHTITEEGHPLSRQGGSRISSFDVFSCIDSCTDRYLDHDVYVPKHDITALKVSAAD